MASVQDLVNRGDNPALFDPDVDPTHTGTCGSDVVWTTNNVAEAFPGVATPLATSLFEWGEVGVRQGVWRIGAYERSEAGLPAAPERRIQAPFFGYTAANVDVMMDIASRIPAVSAEAMAAQIYGTSSAKQFARDTRRRYGVVFAKAPFVLVRLGREIDAKCSEIRESWCRAVDSAACMQIDEAQRLLIRSFTFFGEILGPQWVGTLVGSGIVARLLRLAQKQDLDAEMSAALVPADTGDGDVAELLWSVAHGEMTLQEFIARYGYHGPDEAQLQSRPWRIDDSPLQRLLVTYREMGPNSEKAPAARRQEVDRRRSEGSAAVLAKLPHFRRRITELQMACALRCLELRQRGKAGFLMSIDGARIAVDVIGSHLVDAGKLDAVSDAHFLTISELMSDVLFTHDLRDLVARRRLTYERNSLIELPTQWSGVPVPHSKDERLTPGGRESATGMTIQGDSGGPGVAEGRARVITDPADAEFDDGDVLVCSTTDVGWIPLFLAASAVVTDLGGLLSHGAIVARELGLPCVCNTQSASSLIPDGALIRVDGGAGVVVILDATAGKQR